MGPKKKKQKQKSKRGPRIDPARMAELKKKRKFRKYYYRGVEVEKLLDLPHGELLKLVTCRARRRFRRGLKEGPRRFIQRLRRAKKRCAGDIMKKPDIIKTHLRSMFIVPEMVGAQIGVYNGKGYILVEVKPDMIGHYLGEYAITYKPVGHGRPGVGSTGSSRFIPLK